MLRAAVMSGIDHLAPSKVRRLVSLGLSPIISSSSATHAHTTLLLPVQLQRLRPWPAALLLPVHPLGRCSGGGDLALPSAQALPPLCLSQVLHAQPRLRGASRLIAGSPPFFPLFFPFSPPLFLSSAPTVLFSLLSPRCAEAANSATTARACLRAHRRRSFSRTSPSCAPSWSAPARPVSCVL